MNKNIYNFYSYLKQRILMLYTFSSILEIHIQIDLTNDNTNNGQE